ncbi:hypothetical protein ND748_33525, partial [Frankia sp. AiPs1]
TAVEATAAAGAALAVALGVRYAGRAPSVYLMRAVEVTELLLLLATVPVACVVVDLYAHVRDLAG